MGRKSREKKRKKGIFIPQTIAGWLRNIGSMGGDLAFNEALSFYLDTKGDIIRQMRCFSPDELVWQTWMNIDKFISEDVQLKEKKCGKGCFHCCCMYAHVFDTEADTIMKYCLEKGIEIDPEALKSHIGKTEEDYIGSCNNRCVFLADDNSCRIYEARPGKCRLHMVATEPKMCALDESRTVGKLICINAEFVMAAFVELSYGTLDSSKQAGGNLADMLLARLTSKPPKAF